MLLSVLLVIAFIIPGLGIRKVEDGDYMDKKVTSSVMGVFTIIIFFSHVTGRMGGNEWFNVGAIGVYQSFFSQMMVVPFLFYSAYGIVTQYYKKGRKQYLSNFFIQRFLKIYLILVFCFIFGAVFESACTGFTSFNFYPIDLTVWGSTFWFAFAILACYLIIFISLLVFGEKKILLLISTAVLSVGLIILMIVFGKATYWYNTVIMFPVGVGFALYKDKFDQVFNSLKRKIILFSISTVIYCATLALTEFVDLLSVHVSLYTVIYAFRAISFMSSVISFMTIFKFGNKALVVISGYAIFSYILQYYAFRSFKNPPSDVYSVNVYLYMLATLGVTIALSIIVKFLYDMFYKYTLGKLKFPLRRKEENKE